MTMPDFSKMADGSSSDDMVAMPAWG